MIAHTNESCHSIPTKRGKYRGGEVWREKEMENVHLSNCWCLRLMRSLVNCAYAAVWKLMVCLLNRRVSILWTPILCKIGFWGSESGAECIPGLLSHVLSTLIVASFWVDEVLQGSDSGTKSSGFKIWLSLLIRCYPWACHATVLCCLCLEMWTYL